MNSDNYIQALVKPVPIQYDFDLIHAEFKKFNNWLLWKYKARQGKWTKVPYQTNGKRADSTNPKTWNTFEEVDLAYMVGDFDGIGFAIGDSGLTCIDVDHISEWKFDVPLKPIEDLGYFELSPSGDGLHLWVKAEKPNNKCKSKNFHNSKIEVYNADRFITMTGNEAKGDFVPCQDEFNAAFKDLFFPQDNLGVKIKKEWLQPLTEPLMDDQEIIDRIMNEQSTGRNDWITYHEYGAPDGADASACDQAYVNKIAFYTKDHAQIERIWLNSEIGRRGKTQSRQDYRKRTIENAMTVDDYQPTNTGDISDAVKTSNEIELAHKDADLISICRNTVIAKFASELSAEAKMPRNTTLLSVLSLVGSVACRSHAIGYQYSGIQPLSLNFAGQQPPGASKSRVLIKTKGFIDHESRSTVKEIRKQIKDLKKDLELADGKEEKAPIREQIAALHAQANAVFDYITDTTPEALDMALDGTNGYYAIASAEQAAINTLLGVSYKDSNSVANRDLILKGFNGEYHHSKRKGRETYQGFVVGSVTALAQDGMIQNIINASDASGVVERFILWDEDDLLGERDHNVFHKMDDFIEAEFQENMMSLYRQCNGIDFQDLPKLSLSVRAWDKINAKRNEYEPTIAKDGKNNTSLMRGVIAKYDLFVMKIAGILHLGEQSGSIVVHDDRVNEAMAIMDAYVIHLHSLINEASLAVFSDRERAISDLIGIKSLTGKQIADKIYRKKCFKKGDTVNRSTVYDELNAMAKVGKLNYKQTTGTTVSTALFTNL